MVDRRVLCGVAAYAILCSSSAWALEPKQCLPLAEMNAALRAEGQRTLIIGNREALNNDASRSSGVRITRYADAVTANADMTLGYQIEGDLPRDQTSTSFCVGAKLTNIRLLDARRPGTVTAALLGGAFDADVRAKEKLGTRPMIIADTVHQTAGRSSRLGLPMILFWNSASRSAGMFSRQADGTPIEMMIMGETDYTPVALQRLDATASAK